jgi:diguanylate cyclase (GGDEF)-like protein
VIAIRGEIPPDAGEVETRVTWERSYAIVLAVIALGLTLLATVAYPIHEAISFGLPGLDPGVVVLAGVGYWTLFGLVGALRSRPVAAGTVLTFHMPFIVAATILGGPVVGAWMGWLSQFERRELEEVPWYGLLGNHATITVAAVSAGLAGDAVRLAATDIGAQGGAAQFLAALTVGLTFAAVNLVLVLPLVSMRRGVSLQEAISFYDQAFRATVLAEAILAWLMALVYLTAGWWAPVVCVALVLVIWQAHDREQQSQVDDMTGVRNEKGFLPHLEKAVRESRAGGRLHALLMLDLNDFGDFNKVYGPDVGDDVLRAVAGRLHAAVRDTDVVGRSHRAGDEFMVLLTNLPDADKARELAARICQRVAAPVMVRDDSLVVNTGTSIGVVLLDGTISSARDAIMIGDRRMQYAKRHGLGIWADEVPPDEGRPFA